MNENTTRPVRDGIAPTPTSATAAGIRIYSRTLTHPLHRASRTGLLSIILVVAALADVFLAVGAFNGVLKSSPIVSFFCAVAFVTVAVGSSLAAGRALRHGHLLAVIGAAAAVVLLTAGLFVLRVNAAGLNSTTAVFDGSPTDTGGAQPELFLASVFAGLMLATSILAIIDGWELTATHDEAALRGLTRELNRTDADIAGLEGEQVRLVENEAIASERIELLNDDLAVALDALHAFAVELQELARTEVARALGLPAATSGLDLPLSRPAPAPSHPVPLVSQPAPATPPLPPALSSN